MRPHLKQATLRSQQGVSLIELMIALTIGVVVMIALTIIYVQDSRSRLENERIARQTESGRFAVQTIASDLQQAGYYAEFDPRPSAGSPLTEPTTVPDPCDPTLAKIQTLAGSPLLLAVQGYYQGTGLTSNCTTLLADRKTGTDVLVVRRVSNCVVGATNCDAKQTGDYLFQASSCVTQLAIAATHFVLDTDPTKLIMQTVKCDSTKLAPIRRFLVHVYYISNSNKSSDGVPTLRRAELGAGGFSVVPLVDGVETLHVEFGIDNTVAASATGAPVFYTAKPDGYNSCTSTTAPTCVQYWEAAVSAKVYLVARNGTLTPGYTDGKTYNLGLQSDGATANTYTPTGSDRSYQRHVYSTVARFNNASNRSATQ
jgi:type IV pilus assembly protein PilW